MGLRLTVPAVLVLILHSQPRKGCARPTWAQIDVRVYCSFRDDEVDAFATAIQVVSKVVFDLPGSDPGAAAYSFRWRLSDTGLTPQPACCAGITSSVSLRAAPFPAPGYELGGLFIPRRTVQRFRCFEPDVDKFLVVLLSNLSEQEIEPLTTKVTRDPKRHVLPPRRGVLRGTGHRCTRWRSGRGESKGTAAGTLGTPS